MATNFVQQGSVLTLTAPYALSSGDGFKVGSILAVAAADAASGATVEGITEGVFTLPKLSTGVVAVGDQLYWDDTNKEVTLTDISNTLIGVATTAAGNGVTTVNVRLNGSF